MKWYDLTTWPSEILMIMAFLVLVVPILRSIYRTCYKFEAYDSKKIAYKSFIRRG